MGDMTHIWHFLLTRYNAVPIFKFMSSQIQEKALAALFGFLRPLITALMRAGVGYAEFSEVAKAAYVQVCLDEFGVRGRQTNLSRVAVMTGLSRKEVSRIRQQEIEGNSYSCDSRNPVSEIIHLWYTDPLYLDVDGNPAVLPFDSKGASFSSLVKRVPSDLPPGAVKTELIRMGVVSSVGSNRLCINRREFVPDSSNERLVEGLLAGLKSHMETVAFNADPANPKETRYEVLVECLDVDPVLLRKLRKVSRKKLYEFASGFDDYIAEYELNDEGAETRRAGIGVYYFEDDKKNRQ